MSDEHPEEAQAQDEYASESVYTEQPQLSEQVVVENGTEVEGLEPNQEGTDGEQQAHIVPEESIDENGLMENGREIEESEHVLHSNQEEQQELQMHQQYQVEQSEMKANESHEAINDQEEELQQHQQQHGHELSEQQMQEQQSGEEEVRHHHQQNMEEQQHMVEQENMVQHAQEDENQGPPENMDETGSHQMHPHNDMEQQMMQEQSMHDEDQHQHMVQEGQQVHMQSEPQHEGHGMSQQEMHHGDGEIHYHQGGEGDMQHGDGSQHQGMHDEDGMVQDQMMQDGHHLHHQHHQHILEQQGNMEGMNEEEMHAGQQMGAYDEDQIMGHQQEQIKQDMARMPTNKLFASLSTRKRLTSKEQKKLKEDGLKVRFENVIYKRQLLLTKTRLRYALEALNFVKTDKPYQKLAALANDERKCLKEIAPLLAQAKPLLKPPPEQQQPTEQFMKTVDTKKGERQRPSKYNTKSREEFALIAAAADSVIHGLCTLREAKDALREIGATNFETSLSNKIYNHKDKQQYLKNRSRNRDESSSVYMKSVVTHNRKKRHAPYNDTMQHGNDRNKMARPEEEELTSEEYLQQHQQAQQQQHQQSSQQLSEMNRGQPAVHYAGSHQNHVQHMHNPNAMQQRIPQHPPVMMMMAPPPPFANQSHMQQNFIPPNFQGQQQQQQHQYSQMQHHNVSNHAVQTQVPHNQEGQQQQQQQGPPQEML